MVTDAALQGAAGVGYGLGVGVGATVGVGLDGLGSPIAIPGLAVAVGTGLGLGAANADEAVASSATNVIVPANTRLIRWLGMPSSLKLEAINDGKGDHERQRDS